MPEKNNVMPNEFYNKLLKKVSPNNSDLHLLDSDNIYKIVSSVKKKFPDYRIFAQRGYNAIKKLFFAHEYVLDTNYYSGVKNALIEFENFGDYYNQLEGDIYSHANYWGYIFSDIEIKNYNIDLNKINCEASIIYTINETIKGLKSREDIIAKRLSAADAYIKNHEEMKSSSDVRHFIKRSPIIYRNNYDEENFLSIIMIENTASVKNAIISYFVNNANSFLYWLPVVYEIYGIDVVDEIASQCKFVGYAPSTVNNKKTRLNSLLRKIRAPFDKKRCIGFSRNKLMYYISDKFFEKGQSNSFASANKYFVNFNSFVKYVNNDLSGADLLHAPIDRKDVLKYHIDQETKLPYDRKATVIQVDKLFKNNEFVVRTSIVSDDGQVIESDSETFDALPNLVFYLMGDLSNADFHEWGNADVLSWDSSLDISNINVQPDIALKLGLIKEERVELGSIVNFPEIMNNEENTRFALETVRNNDDASENEKEIQYITDIHLVHRLKNNKCLTNIEIDNCVQRQVDILLENFANTSTILIGGDIVTDFDLFKLFLKKINCSSKMSEYNHIFITLGNHELWSFEGYELDKIISIYREEIKGNNIKLLHNNIYYYENIYTLKEIKEEDLANMTIEDLKERTKFANIIIFGGIGFSGMNNKYNADMGFYRNVVTREQEIEESNKFYSLYQKVADALAGRNVIVLAHMPFEDWSKNQNMVQGFVYVSGHNHMNKFIDDGDARVYSDNQIGYKSKDIKMKSFYMNKNYDIFADYADGIYDISKAEYSNYYRGLGIAVDLNRQLTVYMLKKNKTYMFLGENEKGKLFILNGGMINKAEHGLTYYYLNMEDYCNAISGYLNDYLNYQKEISKEIQRIGGDGTIHGTIIDIDFYNHIYVNPLDRKLIPYFAYSITDKYVYDNIPSLLQNNCPNMYKLLEKKGFVENGIVKIDESTNLTNRQRHVADTTMYKLSRIVKALQYTSQYSVIRKWNDQIIQDNDSKDKGKKLFLYYINE